MERYLEALKKIHEIATFAPAVDPIKPSMLEIVDINEAMMEIWEIAAGVLAEEVANNPEISEIPTTGANMETEREPMWEAPPEIDPDFLVFP